MGNRQQRKANINPSSGGEHPTLGSPTANCGMRACTTALLHIGSVSSNKQDVANENSIDPRDESVFSCN